MTEPSRLITRRAFGVALGASAFALGCGSRAQAQPSPVGGVPDVRIDVHHHILPPEYVRGVGREAIGRLVPNGNVPEWSVESSLAVMDESGISASIASISSPALQLDDRRAAARLARVCNEFAARMVSDHPNRFGFFAVLPMPDVEASIAELEYATEALRCDGIGLMTNYGSRYLGDADFQPLFEEINDRRLVVYVHPDVCDCDIGVLPEIPVAMIDFPHSTTRTIVSLLHRRTFVRCSDTRFIFSHAGGTVPFLAQRIVGNGAALGQSDWFANLQTLYYDTAGSMNLFALEPLLRLVTSQNVLLGTDFPFAAAAAVRSRVEELRRLGFADDAVADIELRNAKRLFRRFAQ